MILGYVIGETDGDLDFYEDAPPHHFCKECGCVIDKNYLPKQLKVSRKARTCDIFSTYDGKTLVSERGATFFRHTFEESCLLTMVNEEPPLYLLEASQTVEYDFLRGETRLLDLCEECGQYKSVMIGRNFLKIKQPLPHGLYRTDIEFATSQSKHPLLIVGEEDVLLMKSFKAHGGGLYLEPIYL